LDAPAFAGAGMIRSTANDMLVFLAANMRMAETELQPPFRLANTPQRPIFGQDYIGLGWSLPSTGKGIHWHNGETYGYHSYLAWDSQRKIGVVVLTNATINIDDVGLQHIRGLFKPVQVNPQILAAYAGRYQFSNDIVVIIRVDGTRIFIQAPNQPEYELVARSENQFTPRVFDAEITFYKNDNGEVDRMVMMQNGLTSESKKVP
jgi:CubicO group peptidase (beta-lactamase class C family)